jgi:hypothetical protein
MTHAPLVFAAIAAAAHRGALIDVTKQALLQYIKQLSAFTTTCSIRHSVSIEKRVVVRPLMQAVDAELSR